MYIFIFIAYCSQGCYNGGTCTSPGICTCADGWKGADCREGNCICRNFVLKVVEVIANFYISCSCGNIMVFSYNTHPGECSNVL